MDRTVPPMSLQAQVTTLRNLTLGVSGLVTRQRIGAPVWDPNREAMIADEMQVRVNVPKLFARWETSRLGRDRGHLPDRLWPAPDLRQPEQLHAQRVLRRQRGLSLQPARWSSAARARASSRPGPAPATRATSTGPRTFAGATASAAWRSGPSTSRSRSGGSRCTGGARPRPARSISTRSTTPTSATIRAAATRACSAPELYVARDDQGLLEPKATAQVPDPAQDVR